MSCIALAGWSLGMFRGVKNNIRFPIPSCLAISKAHRLENIASFIHRLRQRMQMPLSIFLPGAVTSINFCFYRPLFICNHNSCFSIIFQQRKIPGLRFGIL